MAQILSPGTAAPHFTLHVTPDQCLSLEEFPNEVVHGSWLRQNRFPADRSLKLEDPSGAIVLPGASRPALRMLPEFVYSH